MKILIFCILKLIFIAESDSVPSVICEYPGNIPQIDESFKFSESEINPRCEALQIGRWELDDPIPASDPVTQAIACALNANKPVFLLVSFVGKSQYPAIIDSDDTSKYDELVAPMLKFVQENKVDGIVLDYLQLANKLIVDYAPKLNAFICKMKATIPKLQVAVTIDPWSYVSFSDATVFDYCIANQEVDMFVINVIQAGVSCDQKALQTSLLPISSNDTDVISLDEICEAAKNSPMDQSKLIVLFMISVQMLKGDQQDQISYSNYCKLCASGQLDSSTIYCRDSVEIFYNQAKFASNYFKGMILSTLETDDFDDSCKCGKYPIANAYIDGFQNKNMTSCAALS